MEKLWRVQRLKDGTYGDWRLFKENKEGIIFTKGKIYKYKIKEDKMKILILEGLHGNNKGKKCQWKLKRTNLKVGDRVVLNCHDWKIIKVVKEKKRSIFPKGAVFSECSTGYRPNEVYQYLEGLDEKEVKVEILTIKDTETGAYRKVRAKEVGYLNPTIGDHINPKEIIVRIGKEVKKVRPYFETKVVKVKKEKCKHLEVLFKNGIFKCTHCGHRLKIKRYDKNTRWGWAEFSQEQLKGNWVNGENLDKIKFPCFCSYIVVVTGEKRYGKIDQNWDDIAYKEKYQISKIMSQGDEISVLYEDVSLKKLITNLKIKILKGKIIIYDEEEE